MTSVWCTFAWKNKHTKSKTQAKTQRVCGRLGKLQSPPADPFSVFLFLPSKTELVKLQGLRPASIGTDSKKKKKKKRRRDKSPQGVLALCTVSCHSPALSLGLGGGGGLTALSATRVTPVHRTRWLLESVSKKLLSPLEISSNRAGNVLQDYFLLAFLLQLILKPELFIVFD